jgi:nitrile hydratase accessory protein
LTTSPLDLLGPDAAIPRDNGEPVFAEPWEATVFGLAVALHEQGAIDWESFRTRLIAAIAERPGAPYYDNWSRALQGAVVEAGLLTAEDVRAQIGSLRAG